VGQRLSFSRKGSRLAEVAARWVFVVRTILNSFQMCCLVKIAHYANESRQESVAGSGGHKSIVIGMPHRTVEKYDGMVRCRVLEKLEPSLLPLLALGVLKANVGCKLLVALQLEVAHHLIE